eukprot:m.924963 g.924963  ORF g.924963 m.924963 type:complete len:98 (+) comp125693_c0_seq1:40-333(+)
MPPPKFAGLLRKGKIKSETPNTKLLEALDLVCRLLSRVCAGDFAQAVQVATEMPDGAPSQVIEPWAVKPEPVVMLPMLHKPPGGLGGRAACTSDSLM